MQRTTLIFRQLTLWRIATRVLLLLRLPFSPSLSLPFIADLCIHYQQYFVLLISLAVTTNFIPRDRVLLNLSVFVEQFGAM